jgi:hypothetical protein
MFRPPAACELPDINALFSILLTNFVFSRVHTSYVTVEPKRRKQAMQQTQQEENSPPVQAVSTSGDTSAIPSTPERVTSSEAGIQSIAGQHQDQGSSRKGAQGRQRSTAGGRELRRARIVITVRRTKSYKQWLQENPLQAIIAGNTEGGDEGTEAPETSQG